MKMMRRVSILLYRPIINDRMRLQGFLILVIVVYEIDLRITVRLVLNLSSNREVKFLNLVVILSMRHQVVIVE